MMNYRKGKNIEEELTQESIPIENLPGNFLWMHVKGGTKVSNVVDFAKKSFESGEHRTSVWSGSGGGIQKTISCVEIMKRHYPASHQVTKLCYRKVEEFWEPETENLEQIVAKREIPCIHILLSLDEIDGTTSGYQNTGQKTKFWIQKTVERNKSKPKQASNEKNNRTKSQQQQGQKKVEKRNSQPKPKSEAPPVSMECS